MYWLNLEGEAWLPSLGLAEADWEFYRQAENQAQRRLLDQEWAQLQEDRQVGACPAARSCQLRLPWLQSAQQCMKPE